MLFLRMSSSRTIAAKQNGQYCSAKSLIEEDETFIILKATQEQT